MDKGVIIIKKVKNRIIVTTDIDDEKLRARTEFRENDPVWGERFWYPMRREREFLSPEHKNIAKVTFIDSYKAPIHGGVVISYSKYLHQNNCYYTLIFSDRHKIIHVYCDNNKLERNKEFEQFFGKMYPF